MSRITILHISVLHPHPDNPRKDLGDLAELAASIREQGIMQALVAEPHPAINGHYRLLIGHRRLAAAKRARLDQIPVVIRRDGITRQQAVSMMLVENCQRRDLGPVEKAEAMGALRAGGMSATAIAKATGFTVSTVSYYLSLLDLDEGSRERVRAKMVRPADAVAAVRSTRAATRKREGLAPRKTSIAAPHFSSAHPLALQAGGRCRSAGHTARKSGPACDECWESAIREDERLAAAIRDCARPDAGTVASGVPLVPFKAPQAVSA